MQGAGGAGQIWGPWEPPPKCLGVPRVLEGAMRLGGRRGIKCKTWKNKSLFLFIFAF